MDWVASQVGSGKKWIWIQELDIVTNLFQIHHHSFRYCWDVLPSPGNYQLKHWNDSNTNKDSPSFQHLLTEMRLTVSVSDITGGSLVHSSSQRCFGSSRFAAHIHACMISHTHTHTSHPAITHTHSSVCVCVAGCRPRAAKLLLRAQWRPAGSSGPIKALWERETPPGV